MQNFIWTHKRETALREMWKANASSGEIARKLGISRSAVMGKVNRLGLMGAQTVSWAEQLRRCGARGEAVSGAVLTERGASTIRLLLSRGATVAELAAKYGVVRSAVCAIKDRRTWKHVA